MRLRALIIWLALALPAFAQTLPAPLTDTISDFAGILTPDQATDLTAALQQGRKDTGVQVVVITVDRIADHGGAGQRIEDYASALFNQWGVGSKDRNDGILVLVARTDREMRIALGAGYDVMWDNAAQRVIDRDMLPAFREDRYADGLAAGVAGIFDTIIAPHRMGEPAPQPANEGDSLTDFVIGFGMVLLVALVALRKPLGDVALRMRRCPSCGARSLSRSRSVVVDATTTTTGTGQSRTQCAACGHDSVQTYTIARVSSGSSGGGFGGGSSSGGGATGRW